MQRLKDDRGAVGVMVALLMVPLIGFAAISIDVAAMWAERQQLQTGADAAALAVAQDCARGDCGDSTGTAQSLATANVEDGAASATVSSAGAGEVSVTTSGVREHWFAPVLGVNSSTIEARATAAWGSPTGGTAQLPLAISWCDFQAQTGGGPPSGDGSTTIALTAVPELTEESPPPDTTAETAVPEPTGEPTVPATTEQPPGPVTADPPAASVTTCAGPRGNTVATGFGWLAPDSGGCETTSSIGGGAGGSASGGCSADAFSALQGRTVLLPIFDQDAGASAAGPYRIYGYAAFTLSGYRFAGQFSGGSSCGNADGCISGTFTRAADLSDRFDYDNDAPQLGAAVVSLTG